MSRLIFIILALNLFLNFNLFADSTLKEGFSLGNPHVQSINAMTFGPEGILFIGDSKSAEIKAVDLSHHKTADNSAMNIKNLDGQIADMLGAAKDEIVITDLAINPENHNVYVSVVHSSGNPVLFMVVGESLKQVPLTEVSFINTSLNNVFEIDAKDSRGRALRKWTISDIHYSDGQVMVSGLSNQEFASTFRILNFPFNEKKLNSSLEIYHAAHGKYETHSPIKTFTTSIVNGKPHVIASYTCTPLVVFPVSTMKPGGHTKGRTVGELGNRNTPLDIIEVKSGDDRILLMANSSRALMKIKISDVEAFGDSLTTPVEEDSGTAGVHFVTLPIMHVQQLAKLSDKEFVVVQRDAKGDLILKTEGRRWL